jgi:hypothetical protein
VENHGLDGPPDGLGVGVRVSELSEDAETDGPVIGVGAHAELEAAVEHLLGWPSVQRDQGAEPRVIVDAEILHDACEELVRAQIALGRLQLRVHPQSLPAKHRPGGRDPGAGPVWRTAPRPRNHSAEGVICSGVQADRARVDMNEEVSSRSQRNASVAGEVLETGQAKLRIGRKR